MGELEVKNTNPFKGLRITNYHTENIIFYSVSFKSKDVLHTSQCCFAAKLCLKLKHFILNSIG